jgi:hypothetical protein
MAFDTSETRTQLKNIKAVVVFRSFFLKLHACDDMLLNFAQRRIKTASGIAPHILASKPKLQNSASGLFARIRSIQRKTSSPEAKGDGEAR